MNKKSLVALLAAILFTQVRAYAQERQEGPEGSQEEKQAKQEMFSEQFLDKLNERLKLAPEQKEKIKVIANQSKSDLKKKLEILRRLQEQMKAAGKDLHGSMRQTKEKMRETLTLEQKDEFDQMMARMMMGARHGMMGREGRSEQGMKARRGRSMEPSGGSSEAEGEPSQPPYDRENR